MARIARNHRGLAHDALLVLHIAIVADPFAIGALGQVVVVDCSLALPQSSIQHVDLFPQVTGLEFDLMELVHHIVKSCRVLHSRSFE